jgi:hypothetical protein
MAEKPYDFRPPGGQFANLVGANLSSVVIAPDKMVHHMVSTAIITTITPPHEGFVGPIYLIADSVLNWTTSGNLGAPRATTAIAGHAYGFIYDRITGKWYPLGDSY